MRLQNPQEGGYPQQAGQQRKKAQHKAPAAAKQKSSHAVQAKVTAKPKIPGPVTSLTLNSTPFAPGASMMQAPPTPGSQTMQASLVGESSFPSWLGSQQGPPGTLQATSSVGRSRFGTKFMPHQLCSHYSGSGWCRKADQCTFAHGLHELHPDVAAMYGQQQQQMSSTLAMLEARGAAFLQQQHQRTFSQDFAENGTEAATIMGATSSLGASIMGTTASLGLTEATPTAVSDTEGFKFNLNATPFVVPAQPGGPMKFNTQAAPFVPKAAKVISISCTDDTSKDESPPAPPPLDETSVPPLPAFPSDSSAGGLTLPIERRSPRSGEQSPSAVETSMRRVSLDATPSSRRASVLSQMSLGGSSRRASAVVGTPTAAVNPRILSSQALSPRATPKAASPTATVFDRSTLLRARTLAKNIEQGPPGLGMCAPTPTSAARGFGFQFPQPGYISSRRFSNSTSLPPPGERTLANRQRVKANAPWHKPDFFQ